MKNLKIFLKLDMLRFKIGYNLPNLNCKTISNKKYIEEFKPVFPT